jgi:hypothetical protein
METQGKLGDELTGAVSWLASVGALVVLERHGCVHVYRGQIHKVATKQSESDTGADLLLKAIQEAREAHDS